MEEIIYYILEIIKEAYPVAIFMGLITAFILLMRDATKKEKKDILEHPTCSSNEPVDDQYSSKSLEWEERNPNN